MGWVLIGFKLVDLGVGRVFGLDGYIKKGWTGLGVLGLRCFWAKGLVCF